MGKQPANSKSYHQYRQMQGYKDPKRQYQGKRSRDLGKRYKEGATYAI